MSDFYWEIIEHDGTITQIPPAAVDTVKRRMANKDVINTSAGSIPANQIKSFRPTDKVFGNQPLLEAAAQAFNEPMYNEDGSIQAKWVKKRVPQQMFNRKYVSIPAYRHLGDEGNSVIMAFKLPVHEIDSSVLDYCTEDEVSKLDRV